ncbi:4-hydroxy-tetrahydrodipicolinate synthase [Thalassobaculum fulvum]|uniref:4-hydroxy-tetrahydrodipicolinate synthase n=1 Tax=Thalassobaculum fulvum TaxID=1633335 RepID=A0A918XR02_9PROT|nr:4-hydroxy-tetrahydrodipicolinate synthase [Thalassobaculum fulvum]GHD48771.1 4-hydroxy-tetrahydrodipicolinate synthase [Thalassobaculum fulvum]
MQGQRTPAISGIWLPLVTPFRDGELDEASVRRLVAHYAAQPVDGLILAATTGEGMTLDAAETLRLVEVAADAADGRLPLWLGLSGSDTRKMSATVEWTAGFPVEGYLIACPYYSRPSQEGLYRHFAALAGRTERPVAVYNIPYRTGVNMTNDTLLRLAGDCSNVVGLKDCCADAAQSFDLLCRRPDGFAVLTGEDALLYGAVAQGADGGILASAHIETAEWAAVRAALLADDRGEALRRWPALERLARLLFSEPSPAAIKHWLWRAGLIASPEVRLPMTGVSDALAARLDAEMARRGVALAA